ncbi:hypothetical protein ScalyP_jg3743 [Parmales sp. scaly parma]|nr:hypothetical protein ScalyP_jg3743 [Parmales sp. scaly parma]
MVANNKISPYSRMQVWESSGTGIIHFDTSDYGSKDVAPLPYLGAVVEDKVLTTELAADVLSSDTHVIAPAAVKSISNSPDSTLTTITFDDETSVTTSLLFACDGANSFAKTSATQIETKSHPYERKALVATVKVSEDFPTQHNNIAFQRFFKNGPIALLPLSDNFRSIVWSTTFEEAEHLSKGVSEKEFLKVLNEKLRKPPSANDFPKLPFEFLSDLGKTISNSLAVVGMNEIEGGGGIFVRPPRITGLESARVCIPLVMSFANNYTNENGSIVLVGDAAHTIHPMAGQGLNLGIGDVGKIIELVEEAVETGEDLDTALQERMKTHYNRERKLQCGKTVGGVHLLHEIFSCNISPFVFARGIGLGLINVISPIKKKIVKEAVGL